jgi:hypothetical protein
VCKYTKVFRFSDTAVSGKEKPASLFYFAFFTACIIFGAKWNRNAQNNEGKAIRKKPATGKKVAGKRCKTGTSCCLYA